MKDEEPKIMRLSKGDIPEIVFDAIIFTFIWLIVVPILPLAILGGVVTSIVFVNEEKLFGGEDP